MTLMGDATIANAKSSKTESEETDLAFRWKPGHVPETEAWWPSRLFFFWVRPLFQRAAYLHSKGEALEQDDLLPMPPVDQSTNIGPAFEAAWQEQVEQEASSDRLKGKEDSDNKPALKLSELSGAQGQRTKRLGRALLKVVGRNFIVAGFIKVVNSGLQFCFPLLLNAILAFIEDTQAGKIPNNAPWYDQYRGYWLAALLFLAMAAKAVTENAYFFKVYRSGYQARVSISVAVYNKALRLANSERQGTTLGELVNLMQVDASKIELFVPQIHVLWDGLLQIFGYIAILYTLIGWPCFIGLVMILASGPLQGIAQKKQVGHNHAMAKLSDSRIRTTNEALQGILCVKMYTWEDSFERQISGFRADELDHLKSIAYLRGFARACMIGLPGLVAVVSFAVYINVVPDASISASTLFAALIAFNQLRSPLLFYPMALTQLSQAQVSAARLETFLCMKDIGDTGTQSGALYNREENAAGQGEIQIKDATIYWSDPNVPVYCSDDDANMKENQSESKTVGEVDSHHNDPERSSAVFPRPILTDVSLHVAPGELCAVIGRVATGKSTLCSAVLNETILGAGKILLKGKLAYAAQTPWILNASIRDNILFGLPMVQEKYDKVIEACQLKYDFEYLDYGDLTEIGERGINLSGGQKQRVSMARAAYSDADTVIMDDPLSALDPEVGMALFDQCIVKLMKHKTRLLVTNQLQFLQFCDNIVALSQGTVLEQGTFADLRVKEGGEVRRIFDDMALREQQIESKNENKNGRDGDDSTSEYVKEHADKQAAPTAKKENAGLVTKEERMIGVVSWPVYKKYILAGGGFTRFAVVYFAVILCAANNLANASWVSFWTSDPKYQNYSEAFYLSIYASLAVVFGVLTFMRTFLLVQFGVQSSKSLHQNLLLSILNAPQSFFDTTPIGRILSRFSKDLHAIDTELSNYLDFFLWVSLQVLVSIGTIMFVTPWFGIAVLPLGAIYLKILNYFREVSRETKRLDNISRSPVYAHFSESLGGLATIRAYGLSAQFMDSFGGKIDQNIRAWYNNKNADRWLSVRLEIMGAVVAGLAAAFATNIALSGSVSGQESSGNFASLAGLSLSFAIPLTGLLNWLIRWFAQLEACMNACERVFYYTEEIPQEAPATSKELHNHVTKTKDIPPSDPSSFAVASKGGEVDVLPPNWPENGAITLKNMKMRYRSNTPLVLKGLSVSIAGGERIGVVGRTGSGKSSLLLTLLRLVEPYLEDNNDQYEAPLSIDGVDALRIGLKELRSKLGIIPQIPVLFSGTVRTNIDPINAYSEDQIWAALDKCGMKSAVEKMPGMLNATVSEYGENLSAGMRQMLVLGRALLRRCRILLLDEATSSVDFETDREIQRTIREAFAGCTVLTIAHRINTIMDSDKILVMKDGLVAEFAPPGDLLKDKNSIFSDIVRHAQNDQY